MEIYPMLLAITDAVSLKKTKYYDDSLGMILEKFSLYNYEPQEQRFIFPSETVFGREYDKQVLLSKLMLEEAEGMREKDHRPDPNQERRQFNGSIAGVVSKNSEDGFRWRMYGQRYVRGSEYSTMSYYKCTYKKCHVKRKVLHTHDGYVAEVVYNGSHNHPKPQPLERSRFKRESGVKRTAAAFGHWNRIGAHFSVIEITGGRGIGKTALAGAVYEERSVKENFELRVWAKLEERELDLKNAARGILKSAVGMACSLDDLGELDEMVRDSLRGLRCLIVLDGIEFVSNDSWAHMNRCWFDFMDLGSKVLITTPTPSKNVPYLVSYELPPLSPHISCSLFSLIAFDSTAEKEKEMEKENEKYIVAENLAPGCKGIPILLRLFGSLIRYDSGTIRDAFLDVSLSLPPSWDASATILLCVCGLPPQLRQCLAYCALFPKGYALSKEKMVAMWIANGLVKPSLVDAGNACFHHLLCRSFFTDITRDKYNNNVLEFRIPILIHEILEDVARIIYKEKQLGFIASMSEDVARISLVSSLPHNLQTLILSPTLYSGGSLDHYSFVDFRALCSLDLSCSGIHNLSGDICMLRELRYLNLSYTLIETLPDSIMDLSLLQTLDLHGATISSFYPRDCVI